MRSLPVFVYGTLRAGQGNYARLLAGHTVAEFPARADGLVLYGGGVPFAAERDGARVVGELMLVDQDVYPRVLAELDRLEGYREHAPQRSLYLRVARRVHYRRGERWAARLAWLYLGAPRVLDGFADHHLVPGGDWVASHAA